MPAGYFDVFYGKELKEKQKICAVSVDANCSSGMIVPVDFNFIASKNLRKIIKRRNLRGLARIMERQFAQSGAMIWSQLDDVSNIRAYIGDARVVTGFGYDKSLPRIFNESGLPSLKEKIFEADKWLEFFLGEPIDLNKAANFFGLTVKINSYTVRDGESISDDEIEAMNHHKVNVSLTATIAVIAHLVVNEMI